MGLLMRDQVNGGRKRMLLDQYASNGVIGALYQEQRGVTW